DDGRSLAHVGYEAGDRIVPSQRPGAGASRLVRARSPDPPVLCDRRLRPSVRHLETNGRSNGGVWRPSPNEVFSRPGPICETVLDPDPDRNPDPDLAHHPALARRCIVMSLVQRVRGESKRRRITIRIRIRKRIVPGTRYLTPKN